MNKDKKHIIFITSAVALLFLVLLIVWFLGHTKKAPTVVEGQGGVVISGEAAPDVTPGSLGQSDARGKTGTASPAGKEPLFKQLSTIPVAGTTFVIKDGKNYVRYVASENGHIYDVDPATGTTDEITNTTFAHGVTEALFLDHGESVIMRYAERNAADSDDVIKTSLGHLDGDHVRGAFLPDGITAVAVSPDGNGFVYLQPDETGGVLGIFHDLNTSSESLVFRHTFREWVPQMLEGGDILFTTKASADVSGFSYLYNMSSKAMVRLFREKNGLMVNASPDGQYALFTENIFGETYSSLYARAGIGGDEGLSNNTENLSIMTIPEKCAWTKGATAPYCGTFTPARGVVIPDSWYKGSASVQDRFSVIDPSTRVITLLADPEVAVKRDFDVTLPAIASDASYFSFVNKDDGFLWSLRVEIPKESATPLTNEEKRDSAGSE